MKIIYKYQLKTTYRQGVELPKGFEILTVQSQNGTPCLWVLVDEDETKKELVEIEIFSTGNPVFYSEERTKRQYIGTFQLLNGQFIGHVFRRLS